MQLEDVSYLSRSSDCRRGVGRPKDYELRLSANEGPLSAPLAEPRADDVSTERCRPLIVLNGDTVICEECYEPSGLAIDPGRVPRCGTIGADRRQPTSGVEYDEERGDHMLVHIDEASLWGRSGGRHEFDHPTRRVAGGGR